MWERPSLTAKSASISNRTCTPTSILDKRYAKYPRWRTCEEKAPIRRRIMLGSTKPHVSANLIGGNSLCLEHCLVATIPLSHYGKFRTARVSELHMALERLSSIRKDNETEWPFSAGKISPFLLRHPLAGRSPPQLKAQNPSRIEARILESSRSKSPGRRHRSEVGTTVQRFKTESHTAPAKVQLASTTASRICMRRHGQRTRG